MRARKGLVIGFSLLTLIIGIWSCKTSQQWAGQAPIRIIPTNTLPIQKQQLGVFDLGEGVYASNDFVGARLNGITRGDDGQLLALITPENTPINPSPWYAFKLWAEEEQQVSLKLSYLNGSFHRYHPLLSRDAKSWERLPETQYQRGELIDNESPRELPKDATLQLTIGPDTLWVSAQELSTSLDATAWINNLATRSYVSSSIIGESREGRPIELMKIGESDDQQMIFVLSRQHPPEVTGYLAMQAFVEAIASDTPLAERFRQSFNTYVVPMANPDGVDNGHWRHNTGGIDLNRDWERVNQPEVAIIQQWLKDKVSTSGGTLYFGVDFHSTWEDIYYTINPEQKGNWPGLVPDMINAMAAELELTPNIRPGDVDSITLNSTRYFFSEFGAESLTYEIGDNTPRDLLKRKGEVSAMKLMELLLEGQ
ncbi:MAG: M14 family metallopeptidase [Bacteroidota bacterium]